MECQHCKNKFKTKSILKNHQNTATYCKIIQQDIGIINIKIYRCEFCNKDLSQKIDLQRHYQTCKKKDIFNLDKNYKTMIAIIEKQNILFTEQYEQKLFFLKDELKKKDSTIKELQDKLENIAVKAVSRPTTTNKTQINNFIQQLQPITEDKLKESVVNLTIDHIKKGPEGYAQYALDFPLKDKIICVDYSRRKVKFKDKDGNVITDPEMAGLATKFFNSIKDKNKELVCLYANELKEKLGDDEIMDTMVKIFDYKMSVDKGSEGEKSEFHHDFVRQICSQTIKE